MNKQPNRRSVEIAMARERFPLFAKAVQPRLQFTDFHIKYYRVLHLFAVGRIKKLIVTVPPQHGKSEGSTRLLPAYILGRNPDAKIAIASYSGTFAKKFNRDTQRVIDTPIYRDIFPKTQLSGKNAATVAATHLRNSSEFEIINHRGSLKAVGRGGSLTGNQVDVMILDDLYSNAMEGNSPTVREAVWEWYASVVKTRLHNTSQELIVFTRWHEDDLIGRLEEKEEVRALTSFNEIEPDYDGWYKLNFEAIKESDTTSIDPRAPGAPLWSDRHNLKLLNEKRKLDGHAFECMYQGHPAAKEGYLYGDNFEVYDVLPDVVRKGNYTDTADTGTDKLCSICYQVGVDGKIYITDVLYSGDSMEFTEPQTAQMLIDNDTRIAFIESNNGGRGFARNISKIASDVRVEWFHQSANKESRILTNAATVVKKIVFPRDWGMRWSQFFVDVVNYKRLFQSNRLHDAPDVLTGIIERGIDSALDYDQIYQYSISPMPMRMYNIYALDPGYQARTGIVQIGFGGDYSANVRELCYAQGFGHNDFIVECEKIIKRHAEYLRQIKSCLLPGQEQFLSPIQVLPHLIVDCARVDLISDIDRHFNYETINGQRIKRPKIIVTPCRKGELKYYSIERVKKLAISIDPASKFLINEINKYRYNTTKTDDEKVPDGEDDLLDAMLYGLRYALEDIFESQPRALTFDLVRQQIYEQIKHLAA